MHELEGVLALGDHDRSSDRTGPCPPGV